MKNKKLNLNELKVKSFVTDLGAEKANTAKGGAPTDICQSDGGCMISIGCPTGDGCQEQTAQNDMTCGAGCFPTDASCGIPCGPAGNNSDYC